MDICGAHLDYDINLGPMPLAGVDCYCDRGHSAPHLARLPSGRQFWWVVAPEEAPNG